jgi:hypothetical protein
MDELLARMRAAMRRQLQVHGEPPVFRSGDLSVDLVRRIVKVGDRDVKLSPKEYELLRVAVNIQMDSAGKRSVPFDCANRISTNPGTVSLRSQSRCNSQINCTQLVGFAPA